jgi:RNA polymerase sigma-70 factor (ECF subfamily)
VSSHTDLITELLRAARAGSRSALGRALEACRPLLLKIAEDDLPPELRGKVGASDLVQESMADAVRGFAGFVGGTEDEWRAWLGQVLRNNLRDCVRHYCDAEKRDVRREVPLAQGSASSLRGRIPPLADPHRPEDPLQTTEETVRLEQALAQLSEDQQQVLRLRNQERLPFEEIGQRLGKSANAARKLWARAVERLGELLEGPPGP